MCANFNYVCWRNLGYESPRRNTNHRRTREYVLLHFWALNPQKYRFKQVVPKLNFIFAHSLCLVRPSGGGGWRIISSSSLNIFVLCCSYSFCFFPLLFHYISLFCLTLSRAAAEFVFKYQELNLFNSLNLN